MDISLTLGSSPLSVTAMMHFLGIANTSIHGHGEVATATERLPRQPEFRLAYNDGDARFMYVHVYMLGDSGGVRNIFSARVRIPVIKHSKNVVL